MGSGLISIAMTGINAAQAGLLTTGNNISNLSTEGYTRQRTLQASNPSVMTGAGGIGQGVHVVTVERMFSQALTTQVLNAQTNVSALDTYYAQVSLGFVLARVIVTQGLEAKTLYCRDTGDGYANRRINITLLYGYRHQS